MTNAHQELMNSAYDNWKQNEKMDYNQFVATLDQSKRLAVLTGNLNYQVENGGFYQWHDNGYSSEAGQLLTLLSFYTKVPVISEVCELVEKVLTLINEHGEPERDEWGNIEEDSQLHYYLDADRLDSKFYEINDDFMKEIEKILSNAA